MAIKEPQLRAEDAPPGESLHPGNLSLQSRGPVATRLLHAASSSLPLLPGSRQDRMHPLCASVGINGSGLVHGVQQAGRNSATRAEWRGGVSHFSSALPGKRQSGGSLVDGRCGGRGEARRRARPYGNQSNAFERDVHVNAAHLHCVGAPAATGAQEGGHRQCLARNGGPAGGVRGA